MAKEFQGHKSFTHWSIWMLIVNDKEHYDRAVNALRSIPDIGIVAECMQRRLPFHTEHGKRVTLAGIKATLETLKQEIRR